MKSGSNLAGFHLAAVFLLLPSTLIAAFFSLLAFGGLAMCMEANSGNWICRFLTAALIFGWFGIFSVWNVYYHLARGSWSMNRPLAWTGLASGAVVALSLSFFIQGSFLFRIALFAWPALIAAVFAFGLLQMPKPSP
jgi:hypothetical protein